MEAIEPDELYRLYADQVRRFLAARTNDPEVTADGVQEVFARALSSLDKFDREGGSLGAWLLAIARNYVIDQARRQRVIAFVPIDDAPPESRVHPGVDDIVARRTSLLQTLGMLPLPQRQVLFLRHLAGLSSAEAGTVLGRSPGAVRMLQNRAHASLRPALEAAV